jgi:hypothetical protein
VKPSARCCTRAAGCWRGSVADLLAVEERARSPDADIATDVAGILPPNPVVIRAVVRDGRVILTGTTERANAPGQGCGAPEKPLGASKRTDSPF